MRLKAIPGWSSHIPLLLKAFKATEGDVLEIGIGFYSTPLLYWLCEDSGRNLFSYEDNTKYFRLLRYFFDHKGHEGTLVKDWDKIDIDRDCGLAFIDHNGEEREKMIRRLANKAQIIVAHDTDPKFNKFYNYKNIWHLFKYRYDYIKASPNTTALSNFVDLSFLT